MSRQVGRNKSNFLNAIIFCFVLEKIHVTILQNWNTRTSQFSETYGRGKTQLSREVRPSSSFVGPFIPGWTSLTVTVDSSICLRICFNLCTFLLIDVTWDQTDVIRRKSCSKAFRMKCLQIINHRIEIKLLFFVNSFWVNLNRIEPYQIFYVLIYVFLDKLFF